MNGSASRPSSATMNGHALGHEAGDEGNIARQPVKFGDEDAHRHCGEWLGERRQIKRTVRCDRPQGFQIREAVTLAVDISSWSTTRSAAPGCCDMSISAKTASTRSTRAELRAIAAYHSLFQRSDDTSLHRRNSRSDQRSALGSKARRTTGRARCVCLYCLKSCPRFPLRALR